MTLEELIKLQKAYKKQGAYECSCGETNAEECPAHIAIAIESKIRFPSSEPTMALLKDYNERKKK